MWDIFSVGSLNRILRRLRPPGRHIINTYYPMMQTPDLESGNDNQIHFEVVDEQPRITPLVSPLIEGKMVDSYASRVKSFRPAYAKDKRRYDPHRPFRRVVGEQLGGTMSPEQRQAALIAQDMAEQLTMLDRRWEAMAAELIVTGKVTVTGDEYPTQVVDFGRDPNLTKPLIGAAQWGEVGVNPLVDVESWVQEIQDISGYLSLTVTMDSKSWQLMRASDDLTKKLEQRRNTNISLSNDPMFPAMPQQAMYMGSWGQIDFWVYNDTYVDEAGVSQRMLPDHTVIIGGPGADGTRAFGAIHDEKANFRAMDYFVKSWAEEDPAIRYMLLQAAPLPVLYRPNATMSATVRQ